MLNSFLRKKLGKFPAKAASVFSEASVAFTYNMGSFQMQVSQFAYTFGCQRNPVKFKGFFILLFFPF